jgi:hypothetical protein
MEYGEKREKQLFVSDHSENERLVHEIVKRYSVQPRSLTSVVHKISSIKVPKILFVYPPKWTGVETSYGENVPLAILHCLHDSKEKGWQGIVLNLTSSANPEKDLVECLRRERPQILAFSTTTPSEAMSLLLAKSIHESDLAKELVIVKGGPGSEFSFPIVKKILGHHSPIDFYSAAR